MIMQQTDRLNSIDALRGFDMLWIMGGAEFMMALSKWVNLPFLSSIAQQMEHVEWNGFHFYDMIFPLFLFLAGVSLPFSLAKRQAIGNSIHQIHMHILKRTVILIILGIIYNGFFYFDWPARYASVLGRIGIAWGITALLVLHTRRTIQYVLFVFILLSYWAILKLVPVPNVGAGILTPDKCIVSYIDQLILPGRMYFQWYDPEGILSTWPAIATGLLGAFCGYHLQRSNSGHHKAFQLFLAGLFALIIGWLWNFVLPVNKNIWTSSFVLYAGGWSILLLSFFYWVIDVLGFKKWSFPFRVIGMNSITIYMAQPIIGFWNANEFFFSGMVRYMPDLMRQSFQYFTYIIICYVFLYFLYRKKIFLKV